MPVYVDKAEHRFGRMIMCHMIADTPDELHAMADAIGVYRKWFQESPPASFPHYDIAKSKRELAIATGAIVLERNDLVYAMRRIALSGVFGDEVPIGVAALAGHKHSRGAGECGADDTIIGSHHGRLCRLFAPIDSSAGESLTSPRGGAVQAHAPTCPDRSSGQYQAESVPSDRERPP